MHNIQVRPVRDLRNNYPELAETVKEGDHVIITNNGKSEAVVIPFEHLAGFQEYLYNRYVDEKLAEAEALEDDPTQWLTVEEVLANMRKSRKNKNKMK